MLAHTAIETGFLSAVETHSVQEQARERIEEERVEGGGEERKKKEKRKKETQREKEKRREGEVGESEGSREEK